MVTLQTRKDDVMEGYWHVVTLRLGGAVGSHYVWTATRHVSRREVTEAVSRLKMELWEVTL